MRRAALVAPLVALGPVTGSLAMLAAASFRRRRPVIGALALAGIAGFWCGAPAVLAAELRLVAAHQVTVATAAPLVSPAARNAHAPRAT